MGVAEDIGNGAALPWEVLSTTVGSARQIVADHFEVALDVIGEWALMDGLVALAAEMLQRPESGSDAGGLHLIGAVYRYLIYVYVLRSLVVCSQLRKPQSYLSPGAQMCVSLPLPR